MSESTVVDKGIPTKVKRSGWVVATGPSDPETYWSSDLDGLVGDVMDATWYSSKRQADGLIQMRGLERVAFAKHVAELEVRDDRQ